MFFVENDVATTIHTLTCIEEELFIICRMIINLYFVLKFCTAVLCIKYFSYFLQFRWETRGANSYSDVIDIKITVLLYRKTMNN